MSWHHVLGNFDKRLVLAIGASLQAVTSAMSKIWSGADEHTWCSQLQPTCR